MAKKKGRKKNGVGRGALHFHRFAQTRERGRRVRPYRFALIYNKGDESGRHPSKEAADIYEQSLEDETN